MIASGLALFNQVRKAPGVALAALGAIAAMCALSWCWGLAVGQARTEGLVSKRQLTDVQKALTDYQERVREGERAAAGLRDELAARDEQVKSLKWSLRNVPKLVATEACPRPGDVRLSVGAVRLYDSALGGDSEQLPRGACGAAAGDPAASDAVGQPACAADSTASDITLSQFQDVSQTNAERFGTCWTSLQRLREFLKARQNAGH